jgi:ApaG protein
MMEVLTTNGVRITVEHQYQPSHSEPHRNHFLHVYDIRIENRNAFDVQLLRRHWIITEDSGVKNEIKGDGVIGVQPVIQPGGVHAYSSYCVLTTEIGQMQGAYTMLRVDDNSEFEVAIPAFMLTIPAKLN